MAKYRIRHWFQFGILDLLILTTSVAAVVMLCRPVHPNANQARPWLFGIWWGPINGAAPGEPAEIHLFPDGYYSVSRFAADPLSGIGWTIVRVSPEKNEFVLTCGQQRFVIRSEWDTGIMELLDNDGGVKQRLELFARLEGSMCENKPHGTWKLVRATPRTPSSGHESLEYRHGELVDLRDERGTRNLEILSILRTARGLPDLTERDFPDERTPKEKTEKTP